MLGTNLWVATMFCLSHWSFIRHPCVLFSNVYFELHLWWVVFLFEEQLSWLHCVLLFCTQSVRPGLEYTSYITFFTAVALSSVQDYGDVNFCQHRNKLAAFDLFVYSSWSIEHIFSGRENRGTRRKPLQTRGQHANSTQKAPVQESNPMPHSWFNSWGA